MFVLMCGFKESLLVKLTQSQLKHVLLGFFVPIGCLLAWWWPSLRGWRTSWCLRRDRRGKLLRLPGVQRRLCSGIASRSWSPGRSLGPIAGRAAFGWAIRWISGIFWSHEVQRFLVGICEVSWLLRWPGRSFGQPWWPTVFVEPYLR